jgi:hypothetical protein
MKLFIVICLFAVSGVAGWLSYGWYSLQPTKPVPRYHEFRLDDGTRCVMTYRGNIDCDWRKK